MTLSSLSWALSLGNLERSLKFILTHARELQPLPPTWAADLWQGLGPCHTARDFPAALSSHTSFQVDGITIYLVTQTRNL